MMKKRLSKKIWYGSDVDSEGKPVLPPLAKDSEDLEGLHYGELYLHIADDKLSLWTRTLTDQIKQIGGEGSGGELWKLMETESGEKYIFSAFDVATQKGITSFADGKMSNLPSIYDGLEIDNQTIVWEVVDGVKTLVAKASGSGEGTIKDVVVNGSGNAITDVTLSTDKTGLVFTKGMTFAEKSYLDNNFYNKTYIDSKFVTLDTYQSISGGKNFVGGLFINGGEIKYNASEGYFQLDGDLLVTGGITAFADRYSSTSIMDAIVCDEQTITVEEVSGVKTLKVIGGGSGGGVDEDAVKDIIDSYLKDDKLPVATTSFKGIASFDSNSFNVSSGHVTFNGGKVKVVASTPSTYESNTLYVIVG